MADFIPVIAWSLPNQFTIQTQQKFDELNTRWQSVVNCAAYLKNQIEQLQSAIATLQASANVAQSQYTSKETQLQTLNTTAQTEITRANTQQARATQQNTDLVTQRTAIATAKTKLNTAQGIVDAVVADGQPFSTNLQAIASAVRANPGILGINSSSQLQWFAASGVSFVVEMQSAFHYESNVNTGGGSVAAGTWTTREINLAGYGNMRGNLGIAEDIVDEGNNELNLSSGTNRKYFWQAIASFSNCDSAKTRWLRNNTTALVVQSMSTQLLADSNATSTRHFNLEIFTDCVLSVTGSNETLKLQSICGAANPAASGAAFGYPSQVTPNMYIQISGWRIRYT